jgi:hypothetical protein
MIGIGDSHCKLAIYIGNRPPLKEYLERKTLVPATNGELTRIANETGNHWRKIFNIYAKLGYMLDPKSFPTWQIYRDNFLLTEGSQQALLFNNTLIPEASGGISIICGKTHAMTIVIERSLQWIDNDFAVDLSRRLIVTPYFDYRQLSNVKLEKLVGQICSKI